MGIITVGKDECGDCYASQQVGSICLFYRKFRENGNAIGIDVKIKNFYSDSKGGHRGKLEVTESHRKEKEWRNGPNVRNGSCGKAKTTKRRPPGGAKLSSTSSTKDWPKARAGSSRRI